MNHLGTQILETERLILRPFSAADVQEMYDNWASDPEVTRFLMWPAHPNPAVTAVVIKSWVSRYEDRSYYQWAIVLKETGSPIGSISILNRMEEEIGSAHIGYCIGRKWWHQGITSEALARVIDFLFDEVEFNRIECRHDPRNPHSGAVMKKCGMRYCGTFRQCERNNQGICDAACYELLRTDR